jgi:hypothetical protein
MKVVILIALVILVAVSASAVTAIAIWNIKSSATTTGSIAVTPPGSSTPVWGAAGNGVSISAQGVVSVTGSTGPTGPAGPGGPTGPQGPAGPGITLPASVVGEVPTGAINGTNTNFVLANTPNTSWPVTVYRNGVKLNVQNSDYQIAQSTIVFGAGQVPQTGDNVNVDYWH